ncbi:hypothetical protein M378DRAFT_164659 [Amanita muscaria Koide BX008]|uniref:Uncharacterized protein n=1 Tax=Amanita muscaria (strain Koide BX008) TaxID=946122 RepID=A0A0C2X2G3_AMAMK|nr:hypothetical protein M378DRAFT_164659 [Amanita muscaria Koide BX008]
MSGEISQPMAQTVNDQSRQQQQFSSSHRKLFWISIGSTTASSIATAKSSIPTVTTPTVDPEDLLNLEYHPSYVKLVGSRPSKIWTDKRTQLWFWLHHQPIRANHT